MTVNNLRGYKVHVGCVHKGYALPKCVGVGKEEILSTNPRGGKKQVPENGELEAKPKFHQAISWLSYLSSLFHQTPPSPIQIIHASS